MPTPTLRQDAQLPHDPLRVGPVLPKVYAPTFANKQEIVPMNPLFGMVNQAAEVETSPWIRVPAGGYLQLSLEVTALAPQPGATLSVIVETCNQVNAKGVNVDAPRFLGSFQQNPTAALPNCVQLSGNGVCDNWIRVVATPGASNTAASWTVAGQAVVAPYASGTT